MSDLDFFVFCWWFCAIGVEALTAAFVLRRDDVAVRSKLGEAGTAQNAASASSGLVALVAILAGFAFLLIGFFVLLFNSHKTNILMWNFWIVIFAGSAASVPIFLSLARFASERWEGGRFITSGSRFLSAVVGLLIAAWSAYVLMGDWAFQRDTIIGRFDRVEVDNSRRGGPRFYAVIDGKRWEATRQGLFGSQAGQQVRAERGAGSGMILHTQLIRSVPHSR